MKSLAKSTMQNLCPCESSKPYSACCKPYHLGKPAPTAVALMRSRYSAYVLGLEDYLLLTWHPSTRPHRLDLANDPQIKWLGLQVKQVISTSDTTATVAFVARYKGAGKAERMSELSQFERLENRWYYLIGEIK